MKNRIVVWIVLLILPLIPVIILYLLFEELNYFELQDTARGIVAYGPIAAYVALVILGYNIYSKIAKLSSNMHPAFKKLQGKWQIESKSQNRSIMKGDCHISNDGIQLVLSGILRDDSGANENQINWNSEMTRLKGNEFQVFYKISEVKQGSVVKLSGICTLQLSAAPIIEMNGIWQVVGKDEMSGTIKFVKN